jgi:hypothetical protein
VTFVENLRINYQFLGKKTSPRRQGLQCNYVAVAVTFLVKSVENCRANFRGCAVYARIGGAGMGRKGTQLELRPLFL